MAIMTLTGTTGAAPSPAAQYLLFQIATSPPEVAGQPARIPTKSDIEKDVDDVVSAIGTTGDHVNRQLGFTTGPVSFDLTDDQVRTYIRDAFQVAEAKDVAVAFHLDD